MILATLLIISLAGINLASAGGGIFQMTEDEISKATDMLHGLDMGVEKLNAKNDRKENDYR